VQMRRHHAEREHRLEVVIGIELQLPSEHGAEHDGQGDGGDGDPAHRAEVGARWPGVQPRSRSGRARLPCHAVRSEEHTAELPSIMRISYAVFCLKKTNT